MLAACLLFLLSACGYHLGQGGQLSAYRTVSIPYVKGDWDGSFTSCLVKEVSQSGTLTYVYSGGALVLQVALVDFQEDNVGFRYDHHKKHDDQKKAIIPSETRITTVAEVSVIEAASGKVIQGPALVSAYVDFDHDYNTSPNGINIFSLGQLTDYDEAEDAAQRPLHVQLARKIVDYLNNNW